MSDTPSSTERESADLDRGFRGISTVSPDELNEAFQQDCEPAGATTASGEIVSDAAPGL